MSDFLSHISPQYLDFMYSKFLQGTGIEMPSAWDAFFEGHQIGKMDEEDKITRELTLKDLIDEFRINGHKCANTNLFVENPARCILHDKLDAFDDREKYFAPGFAGLGDLSVHDLKEYLKNVFTGNIGIEFAHIHDPEVKQWLESKLNPKNLAQINPHKQKKLLELLIRSTKIEEFLQSNYPGKKRFSLEGGEALICALHELAETAVVSGVKEIGLAMAHRGRINVLANFLEWPLENLLAEFEDLKIENEEMVQGDVKYHLGKSNTIQVNGKKLHLSLAFNPSHLEYVYPVILGKVRAKLMNKYNNNWGVLLPVIIHGDAAFVGQGIVMETLNFSELKPYGVGGSVHFIINNHLGFTATEAESRSSVYCTDFAKALEAPIFHVNGNDVEAVCTVTKLAFEFRQRFSRDVIVEICCYRKYGHNETDEPLYTNPKFYHMIKDFKPVSELYREKLISMQLIQQEFVGKFTQDYLNLLEDKRKQARSGPRTSLDDSFLLGWENYRPPTYEKMMAHVETGIDSALLTRIVDVIHADFPKDFHVLPKLVRALERRHEKYKSTREVVWPLAESLAFGSLLFESFSVRLVGQDTVRGTFSQRHAAYLDQGNEKIHVPLKAFEKDSRLEVYNSPLSESAAVGFEFGHSLSSPRCLTIWEAQYGDFINAAQVIVDQFIASSEIKWKRASGLVLLLPHGHEGQGPDHSSGRIERFLQLSGQYNMQITQPSTAAQYFHLLRRQMHQPFRRPLVIFTPKSLLRSELVASPMENFLKGGFLNILSSIPNGGEKIGIVCSGKIYWELLSEAKRQNIEGKILFIRVEQFYPLDVNALKGIVEANKHVHDWQWVQEEAQNAGGWFFMKLSTLSLKWDLKYVGRPVSSVTAEGNSTLHDLNQKKIIDQALKKVR